MQIQNTVQVNVNDQPPTILQLDTHCDSENAF